MYGVINMVGTNGFFNKVYFVDNSGFLDGVVMLDSTSHLTRNLANYGIENEVRMGDFVIRCLLVQGAMS